MELFLLSCLIFSMRICDPDVQKGLMAPLRPKLDITILRITF